MQAGEQDSTQPRLSDGAYRHLLVEAAPRDGPFQLGGLLLLQVQ